MKKVKIYSTPSCVYCNMAKTYLKGNKIEYEDYDVGADIEKRKEMIEKSGQMGVPVIIIGSEVIVGFDKERLASTLGIK
ncbi:MAG: glutaredoxin domain-containing protein [Candidatus Paceibacterota bacterium]